MSIPESLGYTGEHVKGYAGSVMEDPLAFTWQLILSGGRKNERNHQLKSG